MDKTLAMIIIVACIAVLFIFVVTANPQSNNRYDVQNNQSRIDGYKADQRSYNTNPNSKPDDGYNRYLNSQIERAQKDRDQAIQREILNNRSKGK